MRDAVESSRLSSFSKSENDLRTQFRLISSCQFEASVLDYLSRVCPFSCSFGALLAAAPDCGYLFDAHE